MIAEKITTEACDAISYRLKRGDTIVGFALQLSNGSWAPFDIEHRRIGKLSFKGPKSVARWAELHLPSLPVSVRGVRE